MTKSKQTATEQLPNSFEALMDAIQATQQQLLKLKAHEKYLLDNLTAHFQEQLTVKYKQKAEPFGVVNFQEGNHKVKFTTPKNVSWDQEGLAKLMKEGAPVKIKYEVSETVYKELNDAGKKAFMPYRTVKPGKIAIKFEEVE